MWGEPPRTRGKTPTPRISTHSPRVGRTPLSHLGVYGDGISTHSPRVGRTIILIPERHKAGHFNSLAPCGANPQQRDSDPDCQTFQLTRPVWGEPFGDLVYNMPLYISTHSPRVGRTYWDVQQLEKIPDFNSLAPCGANPYSENVAYTGGVFQLTRPVWGEPKQIDDSIKYANISTHSPRVGRTNIRTRVKNGRKHFNSLAPCGANLYILKPI